MGAVARRSGGGYLGDEPGVGKTRTLLEGLGRSDSIDALVVCPAIVRTHWAREAALYADYGPVLRIKSYDEITRGGYGLMKSCSRVALTR
jgi:SNF2 family DNA or RNA helicase